MSIMRRPPHGGRGLKFNVANFFSKTLESSSTRRTWIEMKEVLFDGRADVVVLHTEDVD